MVGHIVRMVCILVLVPLGIQADNWPQWRGPQQDGVSTAKNLPASWSLTENIIWKAELPSWSGSTPVIWGDRIFLTSPSPAQRPEEQEPGDRRFIFCVCRRKMGVNSGGISWMRAMCCGASTMRHRHRPLQMGRMCGWLRAMGL